MATAKAVLFDYIELRTWSIFDSNGRINDANLTLIKKVVHDNTIKDVYELLQKLQPILASQQEKKLETCLSYIASLIGCTLNEIKNLVVTQASAPDERLESVEPVATQALTNVNHCLGPVVN